MISVATEFTPWASLFGGALIGLSAVLVMLLFGRIAGITGITVQAMRPLVAEDKVDWAWRVAFIAGLMAAPLLIGAWSAEAVSQTVSGNLVAMALAGLLVGLGTSFGSGCTSGHGVCGLARLSPRSLVAVLTFMGAAIATVFVLRHLVGGAV